MDHDGPVLFDVATVALAHAGTPVSEPALDYVRKAISGDITAIVPCSAVIGAYHVLRGVYKIDRQNASQLMKNFSSARSIIWFGEISKDILRESLSILQSVSIDGWDSYYARVAQLTEANRIITLDDDFDKVPGLKSDVILSKEQFRTLDDYLDNL